jgi:hypothetical protein
MVRTGDEAAIYARARPERVDITEEYFVEQTISVSPSLSTAQPPAGHIELRLPFDGCAYFTQQAKDDVTKAITSSTPINAAATIGFLRFHNYRKANLGKSLPLDASHGSVPIQVPVFNGQVDPGDLSHLTSDRKTCVITHRFEPDIPDIPAQFEIDLFDPDSLDLPHVDPTTVDLRTQEGQRIVQRVMDKIRRHVGFQNELVLSIVVRLVVPPSYGMPPVPAIKRMTIGWPVITSMRALSLNISDDTHDENGEPRFPEHPIRYNPATRNLEWENIGTRRVPGNIAEPQHFESAAMFLSIQHLGELYEIQYPNDDEAQCWNDAEGDADQPAADEEPGFLLVTAEIEFPGYLMSGLSAEIFDATGFKSHDGGPNLSTRIKAIARLKLDDAFMRRVRSPYQQLLFEEVIPDETRIIDIKTALEDRGFKTEIIAPNGQVTLRPSGPKTVTWLLGARRSEGPDFMYLWIFVEGRQFEMERETAAFGEGLGLTQRSRRDSGELKIYISGALARDSGRVVHEINTLHQALRERYDRVRQRG